LQLPTASVSHLTGSAHTSFPEAKSHSTASEVVLFSSVAYAPCYYAGGLNGARSSSIRNLTSRKDGLSMEAMRRAGDLSTSRLTRRCGSSVRCILLMFRETYDNLDILDGVPAKCWILLVVSMGCTLRGDRLAL